MGVGGRGEVERWAMKSEKIFMWVGKVLVVLESGTDIGIECLEVRQGAKRRVSFFFGYGGALTILLWLEQLTTPLDPPQSES